MTDPLTKWVAALLICGLCVVGSYFCIDRPAAYFIHQELSGYRSTFDLVGRLGKGIGPLIVACTLFFGFRVAMGWRLTRFQIPIVLATFSLALSDIFENWLRFACG